MSASFKDLLRCYTFQECNIFPLLPPNIQHSFIAIYPVTQAKLSLNLLETTDSKMTLYCSKSIFEVSCLRVIYKYSYSQAVYLFIIQQI